METKLSAAAATAAGSGTIWSFLSQISDAVFGVPVQVLLACVFGAAAARTYIGSTGVFRTIWMIAVFSVVGAYSVPLLMHLLGLPTTVSAAVGMIISGGIQIPGFRNWIIETGRKMFEKKGGV